MSVYTVNLSGPLGVISYPSYRAESAELVAGRNAKEVLFTPCDADVPMMATAVTLTDEAGNIVSLPVNFILSVGTVIKFTPGTLTTETASPQVLQGAPYYAQVRARQMIVDLMGIDATYALQSAPEAADEYAVVYVTEHETSPSPVGKGFDDVGRYYDFNAWAKVTIIRGSPSAMAFLNDLLTILQTRRGYYWQCQRRFDFVLSDAIQNTSPLINNLVYQQQAHAVLSFSFVLRHYEQEGWIEQATVSNDLTHVTVTPQGE